MEQHGSELNHQNQGEEEDKNQSDWFKLKELFCDMYLKTKKPQMKVRNVSWEVVFASFNIIHRHSLQKTMTIIQIKLVSPKKQMLCLSQSYLVII